MTILTHQTISRSNQRNHHVAVQAALVIVFWSVAAVIVAFAHLRMSAATPVACAVIEVIAIVAMAGAYIRFAAPFATLDHALFTGTAWLLLSIATEIGIRMISGHQWFALLGSPEHGGLRCLLLIAWVIAPALFASNGNE